MTFCLLAVSTHLGHDVVLVSYDDWLLLVVFGNVPLSLQISLGNVSAHLVPIPRLQVRLTLALLVGQGQGAQS